jgi:hypothetical protein
LIVPVALPFETCYNFIYNNNKSLPARRDCMAECELLEKCGFFNKFKGNSEVVRQGWMRMFCEDKGKSDNCERKKMRKQTGKPPLDNMTPNGTII